MENKQRGQEAMNNRNINMNSKPINNIRNYPYYIPDIQSIPNYPPMNMFNNLQQLNGYPYPIEQNKEENQVKYSGT